MTRNAMNPMDEAGPGRSTTLCRRRSLLGLGAAASAWGFASPVARAALRADAPADALTKNRLLLFTLFGGNDGLNTLVPYRDPLYYRLRPTLALERKSLLPLTDEVALNPHLRQLMAMYQAGEVAIVQDVGVPHHNLSHFESAAIWDSADPKAGTQASTGWYGDVVMQNRTAFDAAQFDIAAMTFTPSTGFASGVNVPVLQASQGVLAQLKGARIVQAAAPAQAQRTERQLAEMISTGSLARVRVAQRIQGISEPEWKPYEEPFEMQAKLTDWFFRNGLKTPLVRVFQSGFDTHSGLLKRHADLMKELDAGIFDLRQKMQAAGTWNDTVVMVQSEFGRRVAENGYGGTDHGTAGPVLLIGGKVQGGVYGRRAALDQLDADGNLKFTTDFRAIYSSLVADFWKLQNNPFAEFGKLPEKLTLV